MVASYDLLPGNGAGPIFWKVKDRRRNRREGKTHKKRKKEKIQIGKVSKTKIQISHIHTVPKSTSESQAQITHLLTAPEPARGHKNEISAASYSKSRYKFTQMTLCNTLLNFYL